ncbi:MAG: bifunctional DNA-formamidopyrimidine glycosylase/DNA-(apurinic or apyrimidinic site) lyase [Bryobacteraceae bacterium]
MPELPEVETVLRTLAPRLAGRRVIDARFYSRLVLRGNPETAAARLRGRVIRGLERRGKFLVLDLGEGATLTIHLGMTGRLLWQGTPGPYTRAVLILDRGRLVYDDVRQFGRIELARALPGRVARLGPDALAIPEPEFAARLRARRGRIKPLLLNQAFVSGLGNIYTDEALYRARIHPRAIASRLSRERVRRLYQAIREVLGAAISSGGSSVSDYVDGEGRAGFFQFQHQVYGRTGEPCPACGTPIRRIVIAQRGTHYCPKCQRV